MSAPTPTQAAAPWTAEQIDPWIDAVLRAGGSSPLRHYMPRSQDAMRYAMRMVLAEVELIRGSGDAP